MNTEDFGKYRIERRIAAGGMAELFLGFLQGAKGFERKVAIKRILPHLAADSAFQSMFWDEATLAANLSHPNIVQVLDFGEESGQLYMALEYVDGIDLKTLARQLRQSGRGLRAEELALIAEGIAAGLHHVHTARSQTGEPLHIIHRDISPHNVMVSRDGHIKVMDFGVAHAEIRASKTATGVLKGKLAYMAPEQANDEALDHRVDQFALGLLLWELAVGESAYQGPNDAVLLRKVLTRDLDDLRIYRDDLPDVFSDMVMKMLERVPNDRYPDMDAVHRTALQVRFALGETGATASLVGLITPTATSDGDANQGQIRAAELRPDATMSLPAATERVPESASQIVTERREVGVTTAATHEPTAVTRTVEAQAEAEDSTRISTSRPSPRRSLAGRLMAAFVISGALMGAFWLGGERRDVEPTKVELRPVPKNSESSTLERHESPAGEQPELGKKAEQGSTLAADLESSATPSSKPKAKATTKKQRSQQSANPVRQTRDATKPSGKGVLQLRVEEGWYNVTLGARRLGTTPLGGVSLPVGRHRLTLENPVTGEKRVVPVQIERGEITKVLVGADE